VTALLDLLSDARREPAECVIRVDGEEIEELYPFLVEVTVETSRVESGVATLRFESRRDEEGQWTVQDAGIFRTWARISIEAAFGGTAEEVLRGYVREVNADYPQNGHATVTVECQDESIALDRQHRRRAWGGDAPTSDAAILGEILSSHALSPDGENAEGQSDLVVNQDGTDIEFLRARAQANGYELVFARGEVYFGPWRVDAEAQPTILVQAGPATNCIRFSTTSDGHQADAVTYELADSEGSGTTSETVDPDLPLMGTESADSASSGLDPFTWRLTREGGRDATALAATAQRRANELSMRVRAQGELDGSLYGHVLRVAEPVGVDGVGSWLGGTYYVDSVSHRFDQAGYRESFVLLRNAYGDDLELGSSVLAGIL